MNVMRRERVATFLLGEADKILEQRRFDRPPDDAPDDVEEQDAAEDSGNGVPAHAIVGKEGRTASQECRQPERGQRGVERECAPEDEARRTVPIVGRHRVTDFPAHVGTPR